MGVQLIEKIDEDEKTEPSTEQTDDEVSTLDDIIETYSRSE